MTWYENPGEVRDFRDDPRHPECHGIEPRVFWVVSNLYPERNYPIKVQGFLGAYEGRPDAYWCPMVKFTVTEPYLYKTAAEACVRALEEVEKDQSDVARRLAYMRKVLNNG